MTRTKLPNKRYSVQQKTTINLDGVDFHVILTIGFRDCARTQPAEVFSSSFKVGTSMNAIISDACVLLSRLYQHGDSPRDIADSLSEPPTLVGKIALIVADMVSDNDQQS
jgi:hypothetical protein